MGSRPLKKVFTMNRSLFKLNLIFLAAIVAFSAFASSHSIAPDTTCTLSGRVVDVDGNPVAGLLIAIQSIEISNDELWPMYIIENVEDVAAAYTTLPKSQTDEAGQFSITDLKPGLMQLLARPAKPPPDRVSLFGFSTSTIFAPDAEVLSIQIGAITFYPYNQDEPPLGGITLAIESGVHLENVEVTVQPRMHIRGQIVFVDGTPLANARITISARRHNFDGSGTGGSGGAPWTDDAGYFVQYVDDPGFYTVAAEFQGLRAISEQFILEAGQRYDDLVLTFDSEPVPIEPTPDRTEPDRVGQWALNPANNHSYKRIHCESWDDAQAKAAVEGAHLASINDAAEQEWLRKVFGHAPYWIGLTDAANEGEWRWTSGEPVIYTHWAPHELTSTDSGDEDYVFMGLSPDARWHKIGPQSLEWQMPRMAILEKESLPVKTSAGEESSKY